MHVRKLFVFKTPFYSPKYKEFYSIEELREFLKGFDFMKPHTVSNFSTGLPEFQVGVKVLFGIDGEIVQSEVYWGPRFIVGRGVSVEDKKIYALVPMDKASISKNGLVEREYKFVKLPNGTVDAVIDLRNMYQLWPKCHKRTKTEFDKFISFILRKQYRIRGL